MTEPSAVASLPALMIVQPSPSPAGALPLSAGPAVGAPVAATTGACANAGSMPRRPAIKAAAPTNTMASRATGWMSLIMASPAQSLHRRPRGTAAVPAGGFKNVPGSCLATRVPS